MKIVHLLSQPGTEREQASIRCLSGLANYHQDINPPYQGSPSLHCRRPRILVEKRVPRRRDVLLGPGHYGCYLAHKNAVINGFGDHDFLVICECDCIVDPVGFQQQLDRLCKKINEHHIDLLSLGNSLWQRRMIDEDLHLTDSISLTHCIVIPQRTKRVLAEAFATRPWDTIDVWYSSLWLKVAVVNQPLAWQLEGESIVDNTYKLEYRQPRSTQKCACGQPLHYTDLRVREIMERLTADKGEFCLIDYANKKYRVQYHYIALHGGVDKQHLPTLADQGIVEELSK